MRNHIRRYFVRAGDANPAQLKHWTAAWLDRIKDLYAAHGQFSDCSAPFDASELRFYVEDMSVTLSSRRGGRMI